MARASFPAIQKLAQYTHLVILVRNTGHRVIPNLAVTICNTTCTYPAPRGQGTSAAAFAQNIANPDVANPSRPIWIVDRPPGPCLVQLPERRPGRLRDRVLEHLGARPRLRPGAVARFDWGVTAVSAGRHIVAWQVAAGLNGRAKAVQADGTQPHGTFAVLVSHAPPAVLRQQPGPDSRQEFRPGRGRQEALDG